MVARSRGQLILVAAVLLALVIVASAVLLNGLVAPKTATTSSLSADAGGLERETSSVQIDLQRLFLHTTSVDGPGGEPLPYAEESDLRPVVDDAYGGIVGNRTVNRTGSLLTVQYDHGRSREGDVIYNQTTGELRNSSHNDWTLARGIDTLPRATVDIADEYGTTPASAMRVVVDGDSGGTWDLAVTNSAVYVNGGPPRCDGAIDPSSNERIRLDVVKPATTNATVDVYDGSEDLICSRTVEFGEGLDRPWNVSIANGDQATGTYFLSMDGTSTDLNSDPRPHTETGVVINPAFSVTYEGEGVSYDSHFRLYNETR